MSGNTHPGGVHKIQLRQQRVRRRAAHRRIQDGVALRVLRIVLVKKVQIGQVHQQLITPGSGDFLDLHSLRAIVHAELVIDGTPAPHSQGCIAVTIFVDGHNHSAPASQLNGIGITGILIVLIAVKQQNRRCRILRGSRFGPV